MFRLSLRNLAARKLRLLATLVAIVVGVAFTTGTMILADTMSASFDSTVDDIGDGVDVVARGTLIGEADLVTSHAPLPTEYLERVRAVPGVAAVAPYYNGYAEVIGPDGKVLDARGSAGLAWVEDPELSMFEIVDGRAPVDAGEIAIGEHTADEAGAAPGSTVDVVTSSGRETMTVTGVAAMAGGADLGNIGFVFFTADDAAARLAAPGTVDEILVRGDSTSSEAELASRVARVLPDAEVLTGDRYIAEQKADIGDVVSVLETILLVFGGIALLVGSFTIANTFTITLAQRTNELALARALGASRRQVRRSVLGEAFIVGSLAAVGGLAMGLGIAKALTALFSTFGLQFPDRALVVAPSTVVVAVVSGVAVTVAAAMVPARRAARVSPVSAMRAVSLEPPAVSRRRISHGVALASVGALLLVGGVGDNSAGLVGLAAVALFVAALVLGPVLVRPVMAVLSAPIRCLGLASRLASANALRNPRRSAATAAALMVGVMLVSGASMFASTARATVVGDTTHVFQTDRVIHPRGSAPGIPTSAAARLSEVAGARSEPLQITLARVNGEITDVAGIDLSGAADVLALSVVSGTITGDAGTVVVGDDFADDLGLTVGQPLDVTFTDNQVERLVIGAIVAQSEALPPIVAPYDVVAPHGNGLDQLVLFAGDAPALARAETIISSVPTATIGTVEGYAETRAGELDTLLTLVVGFLGLAVVVAVLGIATTTGLSVHERRRELGILRAVGLTKKQLRRTIRIEAILVALFGTGLGMALGLAFTTAVLRTMDGQGFVAPVLPTGVLVAVAVGAVVAGTLAAALPARRATRIPVLDAVRTA